MVKTVSGIRAWALVPVLATAVGLESWCLGAEGDPVSQGDEEPSSQRDEPEHEKSEREESGGDESRETEADLPEKDSPYRLRSEPTRARSDLVFPALSFLLPGLDQWWEGQLGSAAAYTGAAFLGVSYASHVAREENLVERVRQQQLKDQEAGKKTSSIDQRDDVYRKYMLGNLIYQGAGGFSSYHAFRTAVKSRQHHGQYEFLQNEESPLDLLKAPFNPKYLTRASTYVPLAIGAALAGLRATSALPDGYVRSRLTGSDAFFTGAYSYNAGTHEEAMFRGWFMPFAAEYTGSPFWANVGQSLLFAVAHLNNNSTPLPQLLLGYHLGNVVQDDGWRLGEAIFIHVWWDVLAFASTYSYKEAPALTKAFPVVPVFWLPPLELAF